MEHLLGIGAALLRQHRLNATCSNRLLKPLKPHAHILMYKSAAASVSTHEKQLQVQKNPANNFVFCLPGYSCSDMKILTPFTYPVPCRHWSWKMHEPVPNNFQKSLTPRNWDMNGHGHGIAGCLDLSNTAKIQAGVAGHQFQPECYCYSGRTASCY